MNTKNASEGVGVGDSRSQRAIFGSLSGQVKGVGVQISHPTVFSIIALILVASSAFALGRLSVLEQSREPVRIEYADQAAEVGDASDIVTASAAGGVVASKTGSVYYFPWCTGALKISEVNKVTFASESIAKNAGLRPAGNCKGMGK